MECTCSLYCVCMCVSEGREGHSQHSQHSQGVLLDIQGSQHGVQVGQVFGQQLPALVDQLTQLSHLACMTGKGKHNEKYT